MILFLDDDRNRAALAYQRWPKEKVNNTMWVETAADAIEILKGYADCLEEAHLDHDLGGEHYVDSRREDTGMEVVRYLERISEEELKKFESTKFIVHSWNTYAGKHMAERLQKLGLSAIYRPFGLS